MTIVGSFPGRRRSGAPAGPLNTTPRSRGTNAWPGPERARMLADHMADAPHIKIDDVDVRYRTRGGWVTALEGVSLDLAPRSFVSVVGPSGCGKTTLLKVVSGILRPSRGRVLLDGRPLEEVRVEGQFGFVFQRPLLLPWRTALENVALSAEIVQKRVSRSERLAEARRWLALTGLAGFEDRHPHELSGGLQQR